MQDLKEWQPNGRRVASLAINANPILLPRPGHKRLMSASFVPPASIRLWVTIAASVNVK